MATRATRLLDPINSALTFVGEVSIMLGDATARLFRRPFEFKETINQMSSIGVASVPIVVLTGFSSGAVLALYLSQFLQTYNATSFVGATVTLSVAREIGPVISAIMVAARCGSAMAAQIGTMKVTEQIDALRMLSVHPTSYLVVPRIVACITMLPILALLAIYSGALGGYIVSGFAGVTHSSYVMSIQQFVKPSDFIGGIMKMPVFGLIIALVSCQQGMATKDGAVGVGRNTTNAVVISMVLIYVANFFLAKVIFAN
ncbi:MAG: ABC transporter permease [Armatimonadetes bacterium]|nr:ABC transporter permease [Armatimonadota bacterium]